MSAVLKARRRREPLRMTKKMRKGEREKRRKKRAQQPPLLLPLRKAQRSATQLQREANLDVLQQKATLRQQPGRRKSRP